MGKKAGPRASRVVVTSTNLRLVFLSPLGYKSDTCVFVDPTFVSNCNSKARAGLNQLTS